MRLPEWLHDSKIILVAPLNWGLGHAARCVPIIRHLHNTGKEVIIASDGGALQLLKKEFPTLLYYDIPGYDIHYKYRSMTLNMILQSWKILRGIKAEKRALDYILKKHKIDTVISDNRYGVLNNSCKNVIVCHQINILHGNKKLSRLASALNHWWINRFDECWIPDNPPPDNISGNLSNPSNIHKHCFIGSLSRFNKIKIPSRRDILVILSGPEPKRSELEKKLINLLKGQDFLMIRGVHSTANNESPFMINYMDADHLNEAICSSRMIICRSGYTSIMDLIKLQKKAILIPTPGQYEQEYLAEVVEKKYYSYFHIVAESNLEDQLIPLLATLI